MITTGELKNISVDLDTGKLKLDVLIDTMETDTVQNLKRLIFGFRVQTT